MYHMMFNKNEETFPKCEYCRVQLVFSIVLFIKIFVFTTGHVVNKNTKSQDE